MNSARHPFSFDEFRASAKSGAQAPAAPSYSAEDLAAAREAGIVEGRRLAMETLAAEETAALERIAVHLADEAQATAAAITAARAEIVEIARLFLEEFSTGLAEAREIEIATDLLARLIESSEDRRAARLIVSAKSLARLKPRLDAALAARALTEIVSIAGDKALKPGEARLEWRGGGVRRGRAEIRAAIAAIIDPLSPKETEPHS